MVRERKRERESKMDRQTRSKIAKERKGGEKGKQASFVCTVFFLLALRGGEKKKQRTHTHASAKAHVWLA